MKFFKKKKGDIHSDQIQFALNVIDKKLNQPLNLLNVDEIKNISSSKESKRLYGTKKFLESLNEFNQFIFTECKEEPNNLMLWIEVAELLKNKGNFNAAHQIVGALCDPELQPAFSKINKKYCHKLEALREIFTPAVSFKNLRALTTQYKEDGLPFRPSIEMFSQLLFRKIEFLSGLKQELDEVTLEINHKKEKRVNSKEKYQLRLLSKDKHEIETLIESHEKEMDLSIIAFQKDCIKYDRYENQEAENLFVINI